MYVKSFLTVATSLLTMSLSRDINSFHGIKVNSFVRYGSSNRCLCRALSESRDMLLSEKLWIGKVDIWVLVMCVLISLPPESFGCMLLKV